MNSFRLLIVLAVLCPAVGCEWMKEHGIGKNLTKDKGSGDDKRDLPPRPPESFVGYLNEQADRLQSITNADVRVTATDRSGPIPAPITLRGDMFASQPRNFCLSGDAGPIVGARVILGSNDQQFWVYAKVPTNDPLFVYASHTDFETGKAKIPGGIPFEPEWVMQALGMAHFPLSDKPDPIGAPSVTPRIQYAPVKIDEKARTYTLSWPAMTPGGVSVIKEIVFDGDQAPAGKPQVKKHVIRDTKGQVICFAEVKAAKTVQTESRAGLPVSVQYPTKVLLRWEVQKFDMELEVLNAKINQPLTPEEANRRFTRPNVAGAKPYDLADYRIPVK